MLQIFLAKKYEIFYLCNVEEMSFTMDFNLICSLIQQLLIKNERVVLPQTGELVVEATPASFMDDGKTILPPCKKLLFRQGEAEGKYEQWQEELSGRIREELNSDGVSQVPGLGTFKDDGEGVISFFADPDFDFAPDSFSLEAISLEVNEPVKPQVEEKLAPAIGTEKKTQQSMEQKRKVQKWVVWSAVVVILLLVLVLFVILFKEDFMELLKRILYSKEELEIMQKWASQ